MLPFRFFSCSCTCTAEIGRIFHESKTSLDESSVCRGTLCCLQFALLGAGDNRCCRHLPFSFCVNREFHFLVTTQKIRVLRLIRKQATQRIEFYYMYE